MVGCVEGWRSELPERDLDDSTRVSGAHQGRLGNRSLHPSAQGKRVSLRLRAENSVVAISPSSLAFQHSLSLPSHPLVYQ